MSAPVRCSLCVPCFSHSPRAVLKFKKRYFVDDLNVDKSDPVQLHLVYLQSRDAILSGE